MKKQYISIALATITGMALVAPVLAQNRGIGSRPQGMMQNNNQNNGNRALGRGMPTRPVVTGTVISINGSTIMLSGHQGFTTSSTTPATTFTIDATNAKVTKNNATSTVPSIVAGDTISVVGTLSGTNVIATMIRDGIPNQGRGNMGIYNNQIPPQLQGNGQPVIAGTVSVINGTVLTVTNKSNVTYTVNVSNAKVTTNNTVATTASIKVGDMVFIQGTVNGTSVTASTLIDNGVPQATGSRRQGQGMYQQQRAPQGIFSKIGGFFSHLFGF